MRAFLILLALLIASQALADNLSYVPPAEYYSERPTPGERVVIHRTYDSLFRVCASSMNGVTHACYNPGSDLIHILAIGVQGTTAREQWCDLVHERGHRIAWKKGKRWNHENQQFCNPSRK